MLCALRSPRGAGECGIACGAAELECLYLLCGHAALDTSHLPLGTLRPVRRLSLSPFPALPLSLSPSVSLCRPTSANVWLQQLSSTPDLSSSTTSPCRG